MKTRRGKKHKTRLTCGEEINNTSERKIVWKKKVLEERRLWLGYRIMTRVQTSKTPRYVCCVGARLPKYRAGRSPTLAMSTSHDVEEDILPPSLLSTSILRPSPALCGRSL